jgi:hypothetical protein
LWSKSPLGYIINTLGCPVEAGYETRWLLEEENVFSGGSDSSRTMQV